MGASGWLEFEPYQGDAHAALQSVRRRVFVEDGYAEDYPSIRAVFEDEDVQQNLGTGTILDADRAVDRPQAEPWGSVWALTHEETLRFFDSEHPTREAFDLVYDTDFGSPHLTDLILARGTGRYLVLAGADPQRQVIAFWGMSGD